jgi:hypothetical protein
MESINIAAPTFCFDDNISQDKNVALASVLPIHRTSE